MKTIPFKYGTTVSDIAFTNRTEEQKRLLFNFLHGTNTILISPRRWGKSSLVEKVITTINQKEKQVKTVMIDLFAISSEQEFLETFAKEVIKASDSKWQNWMKTAKEMLVHLSPKFSFGIDPLNDFSIQLSWDDLKKNKTKILDLPEQIANQKGIRFVICLDEFQDLTTFKNYEDLEKLMRSVWQRHKNVSYCLYGSKKHMMRDIFDNPSKPFYRFGDILLLQKISEGNWIKFIVNNFHLTQKEISLEQAQRIAKAMKNHSWYVQQLAKFTWARTTKKVNDSIIDEAIEDVINTNLPLYQKEIEFLSKTQLNLLIAITKGEKQLTSVKTMQEYKLGTPNNVSKNIDSLIQRDIIDKLDGIELLDPVFELWLIRNFH